MHDTAAIMTEILRGYTLHVRGSHGIVHWARVLENGLRTADANGADREVVKLFAMISTLGGSMRAVTVCGAESSPARILLGEIQRFVC